MVSRMGRADACRARDVRRLGQPAGAGQRLLEALKRTGTTTGLVADMLTHGELWDLFGRREWEQLEARFVTRRDR